MSPEEFGAFKAGVRSRRVRSGDLLAREGTLAYGQVSGCGMTWHAYVRGGRVHSLVYAGRRVVSLVVREHVVLHELFPREALVLLYPERTTLDFARLLVAQGARVQFTRFHGAYEVRAGQRFLGAVVDPIEGELVLPHELELVGA